MNYQEAEKIKRESIVIASWWHRNQYPGKWLIVYKNQLYIEYSSGEVIEFKECESEQDFPVNDRPAYTYKNKELIELANKNNQ